MNRVDVVMRRSRYCDNSTINTNLNLKNKLNGKKKLINSFNSLRFVVN